jgi:hypothetical protein
MLRDLSFQLVRGEPPISPPHSRTVSSGSTGSQQNQLKSGYDAASRGPPPLADTARHNRLQPPAPQIPVSVSSKQFASLKTPTLVPWVSTRTNTAPGDITGMTGLLATPAKGAQFDDLDKNGIPNPPGPNLDALSARLRALETENGVKSRRNDELLTEANRAREMAATSERKSREHEAGADRERELAAAARRRQHELEAELQRLKTEAAESARRLQSQLQRAHDEALSAKRTHRDLEAEVARMCEELAGAMSDDEQRSICLEKIREFKQVL